MYEVILLAAAREYLDSLIRTHYVKALALMARLKNDGPLLHRPAVGHVRGKIKELRISFGTFEHRFLFFFDGRKIILTHGFLKKEDAIREGEIVRAERCYEIYFTSQK